ncbi:unnamed protein product [Durusdinium trenchii]|uniref:Glycosyltransferase n=1 Tax=Durusdinium trenchii TaxID=1381693 RepID=A0ABP0LG46_9DINO
MVRCLFNCSEHVGHLNPTLPVVKALVESGHEVHFLCLEMARKKIEEVGGIFHNTMDIQSELYSSRGLEGREIPKLAVFSIMEEHGLEMTFLNFLKCLNVSLELELPGTLRFLRRLKPDVLVYDPIIASRAAPIAAKVLGIPAIGLLTLAGPGAMRRHAPALLEPLTLQEAGGLLPEFAPHMEATRRINERYGLTLKSTHLLPDGYLDTCLRNNILVTTTEQLQDPVTEAIMEAYEEDGTTFTFVGPLLLPSVPQTVDPVIQRVLEARAAGTRIVAVSMGTVVTGGDKVAGWDADFNGQSITGRELCRAVWAGTFDACMGKDILIVTALGLQPEPLQDIEVPSNALCVTSFAQVELLKAGVDVFVTHGGQNSFMEAISFAIPMVVCPGFGDQVVNAAKAMALGVGLKVDRPVIVSKEEAPEAAIRYREALSGALHRVLSEASFRAAAEVQANSLRSAAGVPMAVDVVVKAAQGPARSVAAAGA